MSSLFDLEEERVAREIIRHKARRVLVQLPEGLKPEAPRIASFIEESGALPIISADPCYGACDLAVNEAEMLSADLIVHYGHSEMGNLRRMVDVPVIYVEAKANIGIRDAVKDALHHLEPWSKIGLTTTVQHAHMIKEAEEILRLAGKKVYVGHEAGLKYPGQVLGCNYRNAKAISDVVEAFLFVGGGLFHAIGLYLATLKPVVAADPFEGKARRIDDEAKRVINRRWAEISEAAKANLWGVIIGLKIGQFNLKKALNVKEDLEKSGKEVVLLAMREITPEKLLEFPTIEAYVNTACPRISFYGGQKFFRPILTPREVYVAIGKMSWDEYLRSGLL